MSAELLELTAAQAADRVRGGEVDPAELFDVYRERAADRLRWARSSGWPTSPAPADRWPLAGVPLAVKDLFCVEGVPSAAASRVLEGYRPPYTATAVERLVQRGRAGARQDQHGRVRDGLLHRELRLRARCSNPWDESRVPGGSSGGSAAAVAAGPGPVGDRHRHGRLDPPARLAVRDRRSQAHLRRGLPLRDDRLRLVARPGRPAHPRRDRLRAAPLAHGRAATAATPPPRGCPRRSACRPRSGSRASASACRPSSPARASSPGVRAVLRPDARPHRGAGRGAPRGGAAALRARHRRLLPDRPGRGQREPGALRRRALRPPPRRRRPALPVRGDARARLRRGGQAPDHARHLRAVVGLLRRLLRPRPAGAHQDRRRLPGRVRAGRPDRDAHLAHRRLQAR